jgi:phosphomannomutase
VKPTGFREYDARWLFGQEINLLGIQALGLGLGTYLHERDVPPDIVTGHDFRSYSGAVKQALMVGLMASGCRVHDIGLALSPTAYFAQSSLGIAAVAMVTASHNENGWTGVKMGCEGALTFGPEEMAALKGHRACRSLAAARRRQSRSCRGMAERYLADLASGGRLKHRLKVVCACGNGTAGAFAPRLLEAIGCEVVALDCDLDHAFPRYNPNPEDPAMLEAMREAVLDRGRSRLSASTATATAAASSTMRARRSSPTRSGCCWLAIFRRATSERCSSPTSSRRCCSPPIPCWQPTAHQRLLEDRAFPYEAAHRRAWRSGRVREVRTLFFPRPARPRL